MGVLSVLCCTVHSSMNECRDYRSAGRTSNNSIFLTCLCTFEYGVAKTKQYATQGSEAHRNEKHSILHLMVVSCVRLLLIIAPAAQVVPESSGHSKVA